MSGEESTEHRVLLCDDPSHEVVLVDCGSRERDVILAVRKVTGLSLWDCRALVRRAPVTLCQKLSAYRAQSAVAVLRRAGAAAEWRQEAEPGGCAALAP
ncbi:ribosomal protein L7/L12 [Streptomyces sp. JB150]|uniref:ribosomal protein L7/L12 n=1 Tax=Streptomyces sp. JB150 TaxID=2714844 RepID=UPI001409406E|nr:ribosomal protein L7/L12 [Streptomyces sp. JB150]QIJ63395.1 ribosomal protein L7/L12 [Streptomyces sp. JB150]